MEKALEQRIGILKSKVKSYPDFPKPGILFQDIFSIFGNGLELQMLNELMLDYIKLKIGSLVPQVIVGLESRGFLIGSMIALSLRLPFVPIRKPGKLPGKIHSISYTLEYGKDTFEIQEGSIGQGDKVLIVDDLLATGGSLSAAVELVEKVGGNVIGSFVVMELVELKGRDKIKSSPVHSLMQF